jgi:hypothetical protein
MSNIFLMNSKLMATFALVVGLAAVGAVAAGTVMVSQQAFAGDDDGHHHHKCQTGSGNDFPGRGPGGHCPPGLSKND